MIARRLKPQRAGLRRVVSLSVALGLLAAACGSVSDGGTVASGDGVGGEAPAPAGGPSDPACDLVGGQGPAGTTAGHISSSPAEDVPSALRDANDDSFPEPLVDVDRIRSGGPPPDGIPPIDTPCFVPVDEATYVADTDPVVVLDLDGQARAYPISIMIYHEIVNDAFGDVPVTVSYCPLCSSAVAYDRRVGDRILDFGTSGMLYNSALVMYDRQTESLWSHFTAQAIVGALAGTQLEVFPVNTLSMADFRDAHPDGLVLTQATGVSRDYGRNPYFGYDDEGQVPFLFDGEAPDDYAEMTRVIGVTYEGENTTLIQQDVFDAGVIEFELAGRDLVAWIDPGTATPLEDDRVGGGRDIGASGVFESEVDGRRLTFERADEGFVDLETGSTWNVVGHATGGDLAGTRLEPVEHLDTFWFAWTAFHPDTAVVA